MLDRGHEYEKFPREVWCEGNEGLLSKKLVCIVGSRKMSSVGKRNAIDVVQLLGKYGYVLVSGLAMGIDTVVHRAALDGGFSTIAVLPTSIDHVYPTENLPLAREIVDKGGLLVSEYAKDTRTQKWHFLARNRLMVGLSDMVIIVEAEPNSGTTYSASCAAELGKNIYVFPGSRGGDLLIDEGTDSIRELYSRLALEA